MPNAARPTVLKLSTARARPAGRGRRFWGGLVGYGELGIDGLVSVHAHIAHPAFPGQVLIGIPAHEIVAGLGGLVAAKIHQASVRSLHAVDLGAAVGLEGQGEQLGPLGVQGGVCGYGLVEVISCGALLVRVPAVKAPALCGGIFRLGGLAAVFHLLGGGACRGRHIMVTV